MGKKLELEGSNERNEKFTRVEMRRDGVKFPWLILQGHNEVKLSHSQAIAIAQYILRREKDYFDIKCQEKVS